jgi:hypothetical protein
MDQADMIDVLLQEYGSNEAETCKYTKIVKAFP